MYLKELPIPADAGTDAAPTANKAWRIGKYCLAGSGLAATAGLVVRYPELFCIASAIVLLVVCACGCATPDRVIHDEPQSSGTNPGQLQDAGAGATAEMTALVLDTMAEVERFTHGAKEWIGLVPDSSVPSEKIREYATHVLRILDDAETALSEWFRCEAAVPKARFGQEMANIGLGSIERICDAAAQLRQALAAGKIDSALEEIAKSIVILDSVAKAETLIVSALTHPAAR